GTVFDKDQLQLLDETEGDLHDQQPGDAAVDRGERPGGGNTAGRYRNPVAGSARAAGTRRAAGDYGTRLVESVAGANAGGAGGLPGDRGGHGARRVAGPQESRSQEPATLLRGDVVYRLGAAGGQRRGRLCLYGYAGAYVRLRSVQYADGRSGCCGVQL